MVEKEQKFEKFVGKLLIIVFAFLYLFNGDQFAQIHAFFAAK